MNVLADTGPLLAAADRRDRGHDLGAAAVTHYGQSLIVPDTVAVEVDYLLRARVGQPAARRFLDALASGEHQSAFLTPGLLRRAREIDTLYADLGLGLVDASVMAIAERHDLAILTFDFGHFRATKPSSGHWRLVIDETMYASSVSA